MTIPANRLQAIQDRDMSGGALARPTTGSLDTVVCDCDCDWHTCSTSPGNAAAHAAAYAAASLRLIRHPSRSLLENRAAAGALPDIRCEDCGRTKRMWPGAIQEVIGQGTRTLMAQHNRLVRSVCRERGGLGKNINLVPIFRRSA
ncbi:hypothetical protein [Bosea sp. 2RAB26]|uniref:hypothetical protein n=1 Tax=Bosea sp. 2RAB26 TaxID=3237476 RepID=UPI003F8F6047